MLEQDPDSRVACETTVTTGLVLVVGEISTKAYVDIQSVVRGTIKKIGYTKESGFDPDSVGVLVALDEQSPDIAQRGWRKSWSPWVWYWSAWQDRCWRSRHDVRFCHWRNRKLYAVTDFIGPRVNAQTDSLRHKGEISYLRPDAKAQVTVEYDDDDNPIRVDSVVVSVQHDPDVTLEEIRRDVEAKIIRTVIPEALMDDDTKNLC